MSLQALWPQIEAEIIDRVRQKFMVELRSVPSLDENGYICEKSQVIEAFERAVIAAAQPSDASPSAPQ